MNLTLHWLRRDFLRHAPFLALWALLVALFTWERVWLRTHPVPPASALPDPQKLAGPTLPPLGRPTQRH